jgi:hypothetical protein
VKYTTKRNLYYGLIAILVIYSFRSFWLVDWLLPLLESKVLGEVTLINVIGIITGITALVAYKLRTIG